jgi:hypothetical protein
MAGVVGSQSVGQLAARIGRGRVDQVNGGTDSEPSEVAPARFTRAVEVCAGGLETEVGADGPFEARDLGASQAAPAAVEPGLGEGVQVGRVGVTLGVLGQARLGAQRDVRVPGPRGPGHQYGRHRSQPGDHRVHRQDHKRVRARPADVGIPHLAPQWLHRYSGHSAAVTSDTGAGLPA